MTWVTGPTRSGASSKYGSASFGALISGRGYTPRTGATEFERLLGRKWYWGNSRIPSAARRKSQSRNQRRKAHPPKGIGFPVSAYGRFASLLQLLEHWPAFDENGPGGWNLNGWSIEHECHSAGIFKNPYRWCQELISYGQPINHTSSHPRGIVNGPQYDSLYPPDPKPKSYHDRLKWMGDARPGYRPAPDETYSPTTVYEENKSFQYWARNGAPGIPFYEEFANYVPIYLPYVPTQVDPMAGAIGGVDGGPDRVPIGSADAVQPVLKHRGHRRTSGYAAPATAGTRGHDRNAPFAFGVSYRNGEPPRHFTKTGFRTRVPGSREKKAAVHPALYGLLSASLAATEALDLLDALYDALPKDCQTGSLPHEKALALAACFDRIDVVEALRNILINEAIDRGAAYVGSGASDAVQDATGNRRTVFFGFP